MSDLAEVQKHVRRLERQLETLTRALTASAGIEAQRLYTKEQFLAAIGRTGRSWHRLLKEPGFREIIRYLTPQAPHIYGADYIEWLKNRSD